MSAKRKCKASRPHALNLIKGSALRLTDAQQELLRIFAEHLRRLPQYKEGDWRAGFKGSAYVAVNRLLTEHFKQENPCWIEQKDGTRYIDDLPDEGDRFRYLMENAASVDRLSQRRAELLHLARDKKLVIEFAERYERTRANLGLKRENILARQPITSLEIAAQASYEENQRERG